MLKNKLLFCFLLIFCTSLTAQQKSLSPEVQILEHREHYKQEFLTESRSPLTVADTAFLDFFKPDASWQIRARFKATPKSKPFKMPTYSGATRDYRQYGILYFKKDGKKYTVRVYQNLRLIEQEAYKTHLFLPFKDLTNGESTYGGGRYIDLQTTDIQRNTLLLDFNLCYNPWCAYSDGYNCPIPPVENHLELAVNAGEKTFTGEKKH